MQRQTVAGCTLRSTNNLQTLAKSQTAFKHPNPPHCRLRHDVPPLYGLPLPDVEIFGFHLTAQQLLIAAALTVFFGWRMLVFLAILCA